MRNTAFFIAGLLVCFFIMQQCPRGDTDRHAPQETVTRDTVFEDRLVEKVVESEPEIIYVEKPSTPLRLTKADSQAIIDDYFSAKYYTDTIEIDSGLWVYIADSVNENAIQWRKVGLKDTRPQMIVRETIRAAERNKLYAGANFLYSDLNLTFGPSLIFTTKKGGALHYTYLLDNTHLAGIYWKVSFKKKPP